MQRYMWEGFEFRIDGHRFRDEAASERALERLRAKMTASSDLSVYRMKVLERSEERHAGDTLMAIVGPPAEVRKMLERVGVGGEPVTFTDDELGTFVMRHVRVAVEKPGHLRAHYAGGALVDSDGRIGPLHRPQG